LESTWERLSAFCEADRDLLSQLMKERERNAYLEQELSSRPQTAPAHFASISNSESTYIAELENQLQETRQKLLETKLRLSDSLVEAVQSKQQVENLTANFE
jgi:hypothetical protein